MSAGTFEVAFAVGSAASGALGFVVALLAATTTRSETESAGTVVVTTERHGLGLEWVAALALMVVALVLIWIVTAALLHRQGIIRTSAALWVPALLLTAFAWATGFTIGLFFLPSALFAILASAAATRAGPAARRVH